jgi:FAD/FMN-containing dehydrogenase
VTLGIKMWKLKQKLNKKIALLTAIVVVAGAFTIQKIRYYSADPAGEKNCPPLIPNNADQNKPTTMQVLEQTAPLQMEQKGGFINDASCLNLTSVFGVKKIKNEEDVKNALIYASQNSIKVSMAGAKHSMGGHAFAKNALVMDMTQFNNVRLNEDRKTITVQSGATWHDIQNYLHPKYAVKAMQSTDIFTVGGSISVNAHGMDHHAGALANTIRSMRVMMTDGSIKTLSRTQNPELFRLVIGGYGLFGVILDAELDIVDNAVYETGRKIVDYKNFPEMFNAEIIKNEKLGLFYGHLSTSPGSFLKEMILYTYEEVDSAGTEIAPLQEVASTKLRRFVINLSKKGDMAMRLKWFVEKNLEPKMEACTVNRNQAMKDGEACLVSRNEPMHDSVKYLKNSLKNDTDILHEYFIPREKFIEFIDGMRGIMERNNTNLLNASVRVVHKEDVFLNYAPNDAFSIVLYINQTTDDKGNQGMRKVTQELIDLTSKVNGRFFLPYQLHYTQAQLMTAYPEIGEFFDLKKKYDPQETLTSTFYEKYSKNPSLN